MAKGKLILEDFEQRLAEDLKKRFEQDNLRALSTVGAQLVDFCSNDYLGLAAQSPAFLGRQVCLKRGATAARLLRGNSPQCEQLEQRIAQHFAAPSALLFSSGYLANLALFSALPKRHEVVLYDEAVHASIKDGIRLGFAEGYSFKHNCLESLERKLAMHSRPCWVALEGLYSMDGDFAPLLQIGELAKSFNARILLDEAHSAGVLGVEGQGLAYSLGLTSKMAARVITFGKAFGCAGAAVLGSKVLIDYLINFARPFIYTTALSPLQLALIDEGLTLVSECSHSRKRLFALSRMFSELTINDKRFGGALDSPIKSFSCPGASSARLLADKVQSAGFDVRAICAPTVTAGSERLRIVLHSFNSEEQLHKLIEEVLHAADSFQESEVCAQFSSQA